MGHHQLSCDTGFSAYRKIFDKTYIHIEFVEVFPNKMRVQSHLSSPWSYINFSIGLVAKDLYIAITLSFAKKLIRIMEKHPGEQSTQPSTCSVAFCNQWPTAYSNLNSTHLQIIFITNSTDEMNLYIKINEAEIFCYL